MDKASTVSCFRTRLRWVDALKGFAILTVIYLHVHNGYDYEKTANYQLIKWITSFHMPLFFACSGYFFTGVSSFSMLNTKLRNKGNALLTPYFIWGVLIGFLVENSRLIIRGKGSLDVLSAVWSILTFRTSYLASWFLGALFFVYCIEFLISLFFRHCKHKPLHNILWICSHFFMLVLGYSLAGSTAASYFRFSIVLVSCFFFGLGLCIKQIIRKLEILPVGYRVSLCLISLLAGMVLCFLNTKVTYSNQSYGNLFLHTASASFSILGLFLTFRLLYEKEIATPVKHFLEHFGKHSIIVLLTHIIFLYGIRIIETLLNMEIHTFPSSIAFILLVAAEYLTIKRMPRKLLWTFGI